MLALISEHAQARDLARIAVDVLGVDGEFASRVQPGRVPESVVGSRLERPVENMIRDRAELQRPCQSHVRRRLAHSAGPCVECSGQAAQGVLPVSV